MSIIPHQMEAVYTTSHDEADAQLMRHALELARNAWGDTHPNPMVGAVVTTPDGKILGEGWHRKAGGPHAEIHALNAAGDATKGATIYVTLEPCCTFGRTPPCTQAILRAGIARVVVGATDPNPVHAGRAFDILREAGIEVTHGVLKEECADLNMIFNHWIANGQPLFAGKSAMTLCGHVATRSGQSKWITGEEARRDAHRWRRLFPAIVVGSGTVLADNPALTSRLPDTETFCPARFVFDRTLQSVRQESLPSLYTDEFRQRTTVVTGSDAPEIGIKTLEQQGVSILRLPEGSAFWSAFRTHCALQGFTGVLFEGGPRILSSLLGSGQLDYLFAYRAPVLLGDSQARPAFDGMNPEKISDGWKLAHVHHDVLGEDELMRGFVVNPVSAPNRAGD